MVRLNIFKIHQDEMMVWISSKMMAPKAFFVLLSMNLVVHFFIRSRSLRYVAA